MHLSLSATGRRPLDDVWQRYLLPARWSEWSPQISRVDSSAARIAPGVTGTVIGPLGVSVTFEVLSVDEAARRWSWRVAAPLGITLTLDHDVAPAGTGRTRTGLRMTGPLPVLLGYAPLAELALLRLVHA